MTNFFLPPPMLPNPRAALADAVSTSAEVRWVAAQALGQVDGTLRDAAVAALQKLREDTVPEVRAQAIEGLLEQYHGTKPTDDGWIHEALTDPSPAVRCAAVDAASFLCPTSPQDPILPLLQDPDASVRMAAAEALGACGDSTVCPALGSLFFDDDDTVRIAAALACAALGDASAEQILLSCVSGGGHASDEAILGLGRIRSAKALIVLRKIDGRFFAPQTTKIAAAAARYAITNGAEGRSEISQFLSARKTDTKIGALATLCRLPVVGLSKEVSQLLQDKDDMIVSSAIQTLAALAAVDVEAARVLAAAKGKLSGALADELAEVGWMIESVTK